jgi:hypothetical protein
MKKVINCTLIKVEVSAVCKVPFGKRKNKTNLNHNGRKKSIVHKSDKGLVSTYLPIYPSVCLSFFVYIWIISEVPGWFNISKLINIVEK